MDLKKMMEMMKGESSEGPDMEKVKAKMGVIEDLRNEMSGMMGNRVKDGLSKVEVSASDPEGLKEGLEKAEEVVDEAPMMMESDSYMSDEDMYMEDEEYESAEDVQAKIEELMELKRQMMES